MSIHLPAQTHNRESSPVIACPACGEAVQRRASKFCRTCGRSLAFLDYLPADNLRASYRARRMVAPQRSVASQKTPAATNLSVLDKSSRSLLADAEPNTWAAIALAFTTYALVPYLGILFCPGAVVAGGLGLARARRLPHGAGHRAARLSIYVSFAICLAQLLLWWVLFSVPDWQR